MPQASDRDRRQYRARFGDIGCEHAVSELERRGYKLTPEWEWIPSPHHAPTDEELFWIRFLIEEWDFGGMAREQSRHG